METLTRTFTLKQVGDEFQAVGADTLDEVYRLGFNSPFRFDRLDGVITSMLASGPCKIVITE